MEKMILYSRDAPNPHLAEFVNLYANQYDPEKDTYRVEEFNRSLCESRNSPVFSMHPYHLGKKPYKAIQSYIRHYTDENDLVLDPFCGSGPTALAALTLNRKAIAIDASPAATFITRFYIEKIDPQELRRKHIAMMESVRDRLERLYSTICHHCLGPGKIHYLIYSNYYRCFYCGSRIILYRPEKTDAIKCWSCGKANDLNALRKTTAKIEEYLPVAVNYTCLKGCSKKRLARSRFGAPDERRAFLEIDLPAIAKIENEDFPFNYPDTPMMLKAPHTGPWGDEWRPGRDFRTVDQLFTTRNLRGLAILMEATRGDPDLMAMVSSCILASSRKAQHLEGGGGYIPGNWALPPVSKQRNVLETFQRIASRTFKAKEILHRELIGQKACISTQSATDISLIPDNSIDFIFTDPPYGGSIQYGELNFVWEAWLGLNPDWREDEIIVNRTRGKTIDDWTFMMGAALKECHRALKPGRWMSLCFSESSMDIWKRLREIVVSAGFQIGPNGDPLTIDTGCGTYNRRVSNKLNRRDIVINFRKPPGGKSPDKGARSRSVTEFMAHNPEASHDRIYEHFINDYLRGAGVEALDPKDLLKGKRIGLGPAKTDTEK